jgi:hypothetical protein
MTSLKPNALEVAIVALYLLTIVSIGTAVKRQAAD